MSPERFRILSLSPRKKTDLTQREVRILKSTYEEYIGMIRRDLSAQRFGLPYHQLNQYQKWTIALLFKHVMTLIEDHKWITVLLCISIFGVSFADVLNSISFTTTNFFQAQRRHTEGSTLVCNVCFRKSPANLWRHDHVAIYCRCFICLCGLLSKRAVHRAIFHTISFLFRTRTWKNHGEEIMKDLTFSRYGHNQQCDHCGYLYSTLIVVLEFSKPNEDKPDVQPTPTYLCHSCFSNLA